MCLANLRTVRETSSQQLLCLTYIPSASCPLRQWSNSTVCRQMSPRTPYRSCRSRPEYLRSTSDHEYPGLERERRVSAAAGGPPDFVASVHYSERVSPEYAHHLDGYYSPEGAAAAASGGRRARASVNPAFQPDVAGWGAVGRRWRPAASPPESDESGSSRGEHLLDAPVEGQSRDLTVPLAALHVSGGRGHRSGRYQL